MEKDREFLYSHSSWVSLRGTASQLLERTGPFASVRSVYMAVIVARLMMDLGLRNFTTGSGGAAGIPEFTFDLDPRTALFGLDGSSA